MSHSGYTQKTEAQQFLVGCTWSVKERRVEDGSKALAGATPENKKGVFLTRRGYRGWAGLEATLQTTSLCASFRHLGGDGYPAGSGLNKTAGWSLGKRFPRPQEFRMREQSTALAPGLVVASTDNLCPFSWAELFFSVEAAVGGRQEFI